MAPDPKKRTPFARWMWERGLTPADLEQSLGKSAESIRRYALDFDHPDRRIPDQATLSKIINLTRSALSAKDFYPAELNPEPVQ